MVAEGLGTFFLAFIYLTQTEEKTRFSKEPAVTALIMAASYYVSIMFASGPSLAFACLNPAIAISTAIVMSISGTAAGLKWVWIYAVFPFIGAFLSIIFHEFVYKKVVDVIEEEESQNEQAVLDE